MKHVAILIPASPVPAFFSQIAAFSLALKNLRWSRWRPSLHVVMGGEVDHRALQKWLPYLDDVAITLGKIAHDEEFAKKVDTLVTNFSLLSDKMEKGEGSVGKLFADPSIYNNADQMLVETRNLVKSIRENPKRYLTIHFKLF